MKNQVIYVPFRNIGVLCDDVPFIIHKLGDENFYIVAVGSCFQVFRSDKLTISLISKVAPGKISHLAAFKHDTYVSINNIIYKYRRAHLMGKVAELPSEVRGMRVVGEVLLAYDTENNLKVRFFFFHFFAIFLIFSFRRRYSI
jgi:U3 small nucleolar RNA-associated protein 21